MSDRFPGFPPEQQTWDFPNIVNGYVHLLTGAEFKVLWYILRHTYGWQKMQDAINLSQFERGIKRKSGDWLDKGTGLSRKTIIRALRSLEGKGFIQVRRTKGGIGLKSVNVYAPRLRAVSKGNRLKCKNATASSGKRKPTIVNKTISKDTSIYTRILDYWNSFKIIVHKGLNNKRKRAINEWLKEGYVEKELKQAIKNYVEILQDSDYYFSYKWTLEDFLQRGFEKFLDLETAKGNYKKEARKKKPYYRGYPMVIKESGEKIVIENGEWKTFAGKEEDIEYK